MRKFTAAVLILSLVVTGVLYFSGIWFGSKARSQQFSIDTPEGRSIHHAMMLQMQAAQARAPQTRSH